MVQRSVSLLNGLTWVALCLGVLGLGSCTSPADPGLAGSQLMSASGCERDLVLGFLITDMQLHPGPPSSQITGFFVRAGTLPDISNSEVLHDILAKGEIVAVFRSPRESRSIASVRGRSWDVQWTSLEYFAAGQWVARPLSGQPVDFEGQYQISEDDICRVVARRRRSALFIYPEPLGSRGVALLYKDGPLDGIGNSWDFKFPKERLCTMYSNWDSICKDIQQLEVSRVVRWDGRKIVSQSYCDAKHAGVIGCP